MSYRVIKAILRKDWKELAASPRALLPMIVVPLLMVVLLPSLFVILARYADASALAAGSAGQHLAALPPALIPPGYDLRQKLVYVTTAYTFVPLFLIVPVLVSSVIASSSFAGEKERRTLEGLLYTPATDTELALAKMAVSFVPAVLITWICFLLYVVLVDVLAWPIFGALILPNATWLAMTFWLAPTAGFLSLALVVAVSQRATGMWEAQQISALLVLPIVALVVAQSAGVVYLSAWMVMAAGAAFLAADLLLYRWVIRRLDRERLIGAVDRR